MKARCHRPGAVGYRWYGGKGVIVAERWRESYEAFLEDVGRAPSPKHSLDRFPDADGNYEPGNVRWATAKEQAHNKKCMRRLTIGGVTKTLSAWAAENGISSGTLHARITDMGWSHLRAVTEPVGLGNAVKIDITGKVYGDLTVLRYEKPKWRCRCLCGTEVLIPGGNLRTGNTSSCGCRRRRKV